MKNTNAAVASIAMILAIIWKSKHRDCSDCKYHSNRGCPAISTIPVILWKSILSDRHDHSNHNNPQRSYGLYFEKGSEKFHYVFHIQILELLFSCKCTPRDNFLGRINRFAKINFIKQGKLLSMIPQIRI